MFRRYARTMGNFAGGIEFDPYTEYDVCPTCGAIKEAESTKCNTCAARERAEKQAQREQATLEQQRSEAHEFYREKMAEGWSPLDCWRHAQEQRAARGDPVRPRFWTGQSIGRPK
jgi:hypothetical protein